MKLSQPEQIELKEALSHMHVAELKKELAHLGLSIKGFNKKELIDRLMHYAVTGKEIPPLEIPAISKAQRGMHYPLTPTTPMLFGSYKNDLATRLFFKQLIGNHFHYTAYGIDWLREQWLAGNPPTYAGFAHEWQAEYERNQQNKRAPKQEWALIRFCQGYIQDCPNATKDEVLAAWAEARKEYVAKAREILKQLRTRVFGLVR